jgi:glutaredoxin
MLKNECIGFGPGIRQILSIFGIVAACYAAPVAAQNKWMDEKGHVHYSDLPPPAAARVLSMGSSATASIKGSTEELPAELQALLKRSPVVLFTTPDCSPCTQARSHLNKRGIPFSEKTVTSHIDVEAFRKIGFSQDLFPSMTVGQERAMGFESSEWNRLLTGAGYPENVALPPSYKASPATPLVQRELVQPANRIVSTPRVETPNPASLKPVVRF